LEEKLKPFEFNLKTKTRFGEGISANLGKYLKEFDFKKIGIIVDPAIYDSPVGKKILDSINNEGFEAVKIWKYDLDFEPDYEALERVRKIFVDEKKKPQVDCFVGIGGGSVMDFAKGMSTLATNPGPALSYRGFPTNLNPTLPTSSGVIVASSISSSEEPSHITSSITFASGNTS